MFWRAYVDLCSSRWTCPQSPNRDSERTRGTMERNLQDAFAFQRARARALARERQRTFCGDGERRRVSWKGARVRASHLRARVRRVRRRGPREVVRCERDSDDRARDTARARVARRRAREPPPCATVSFKKRKRKKKTNTDSLSLGGQTARERALVSGSFSFFSLVLTESSLRETPLGGIGAACPTARIDVWQISCVLNAERGDWSRDVGIRPRSSKRRVLRFQGGIYRVSNHRKDCGRRSALCARRATRWRARALAA